MDEKNSSNFFDWFCRVHIFLNGNLINKVPARLRRERL